MIRNLISTFFFFILYVDVSGQVNCNEIYSQDQYIFSGYSESPPKPMGGFDSFYQSIAKQTKGSEEQGKVYIKFIIDTLGKVHCATVAKSDNKSLNSKAIVMIKKAKFIPAEQRGKKVVSTMVLPIYFGTEASPKEKRCEN